MTYSVQTNLPPHPYALIRKKRLLELVPFSKTTLHSKLAEGGLYQDKTFPRPIYLPHSRTPFWREAEVLEWIEACTRSSRACESGKGVRPDAPSAPCGATAADSNQVPDSEPGELCPGAVTGELHDNKPKRVVTTIGGRQVEYTVRKPRTFTKHVKQPG